MGWGDYPSQEPSGGDVSAGAGLPPVDRVRCSEDAVALYGASQ